MKKLVIGISALALGLALLAGCSAEQPATVTGETAAGNGAVEKAPAVSLDDAGLTDNKLLYANSDPTSVRTFYLTVSRGNSGESSDHSWAEVNTYSVYDYERMNVDRYKVEAILQEGDENGPREGAFGYGLTTPNATVQIRGQTSSQYAQKNYKLSLKENAGDIDGQKMIALNKHWGDSLRIRNKLMFDLMAEVPDMMSLRTQFVHLYVRDTTAVATGESAGAAFVDYGLYTWVEQLNKTALRAHGADRNGQLYKINSCEFYRYEDSIKLKTDPTYDQTAFEQRLEIKGSDDHSKLIAMLEAVNDYAIPIEEVCEQYFDMDNMLTWMAFHILTGNIDTQNRNVYIYSPQNGSKWYFWSWDNDGALDRKTSELWKNVTEYGWETGISNYWGNILFCRVLKSEDYRAMLEDKIEELYAGTLAPAHVQTLAEKYAAVTTPYLYQMPDQEYAVLTREQHDIVLEETGEEIEKNYDAYQNSLELPMPFYIGVPVKTDTGYQCEWDASFDLQARDITYTAELSDSMAFDNLLAAYTGPLLTLQMPALPPGQYFIRVVATNSAGKSQPAFDQYITTGSLSVNGTKCFYVLEDGSVKEDVYAEG